MVRVHHRQRLTALLIGGIALGGCSHRLDEARVQAFVDAADQAFLKGDAAGICGARAEDFRLEATSFELAKGRTVESLAEAENIEAGNAGAGHGTTEVLDLRKFCFMAQTSKDLFRRMDMERGDLKIAVDADGRSATVTAYYVTREPVYEYEQSALHDRDNVERQVATRQTESQDESVVIIGPYGEPKFKSTRSVSKSFLIARQRDPRL